MEFSGSDSESNVLMMLVVLIDWVDVLVGADEDLVVVDEEGFLVAVGDLVV